LYANYFRLSDVSAQKSAIITGAGQGLGRAFARRFAHEGYAVTACDIDADTLARVVAEIVSDGGKATAVTCDVRSEEQCAQVARRAQKEYGSIDVLINNAAVRALERRPLWEIPVGEWDGFMEVNVKGSWFMMRAVLDIMKAGGTGSIINISSAGVLEAPPNQLAYITSKAALIGLTRAAARELGDFGIRVNAILPSSLTTEIPKRNIDPAATRLHINQKSLRRAETPDDLTGVALFLAADDSRYMTGQSLNVDGGADFL
jgi:3-oxoacyl-[acyl-carrier protein] reductase